MRMNGSAHLLALALIGGSVALPGLPSLAQGDSRRAEVGQTLNADQVITESRARAIAWSAGMVHVEEIMRTGDRWELAGRTADDEEIILDIDARDGRILD